MKGKIVALHKKSPLTLPISILLLAWLTYALRLTALLPLAIIGVNMAYLAVPKAFQSWIGKFVVSLFFAMSLMQVAATIQFIAFSHSNFAALGGLTVILEILLILLAPQGKFDKMPFASRSDLVSLIVIGLFLLPFTKVFLGQNSIYRIGQIGGIQAIDATNHYAGIAEVTAAQHLTYAPGYYYPKGFHIAFGFIEEALIGQQGNFNWQINAVIFFLQYIVWGILLGYVMTALALAFLERFKETTTGPKVLLAACLAPIATLFYLLPMINEGFLNYYYVLATVFVGIVFLLSLKDMLLMQPEQVFEDVHGRWPLLAYLVLIFGASVSWPLLIPPLLLMGILFVVSDKLDIRRLLRSLWSPSCIPLLIAFALQFVPIYFQLKYSGADASQGINLTGGLKEFHGLVLLAGVIVLLVCTFGRAVGDAYRRALLALFLPLIGFTAVLVAMQYFMVGEIRYYVIKSSWLLEIMLVVFALAALVATITSAKIVPVKVAWLFPAIPLCVMLMLVSSIDNPLKDMRDLFRNYSAEAKPDFFDHDLSVYTKLGEQGKIEHFNSTLLHYNQNQGKFYAHEQLTYWSNMMQYSASQHDFVALNCAGALYSNLAFGSFTPPEQQAMIAKVKQCAAMANSIGETYYIVTDQASAPYIRDIFGSSVAIAYQ